MAMDINQSLVNGLRILLLYDTLTDRLSVSEISRRLGYGQSKTYRLIRPLIQYKFLQENPGTSEYSLGLNSLRVGFLAQRSFRLGSEALPSMKALSSVTGETVVLTAVNGTKGMVLDRVESDEPIRYTLFKPGKSIPLHAGASSKILMAYLPEQDWDQIIAQEGLKKYTENTITSVKRLKTHLRKIREQGFAFSDQEVDRGVKGVSSPIFNASGELAAGLSVVGPAFRMNKVRMNHFRKLLVQYSREISGSLGYRGTEEDQDKLAERSARRKTRLKSKSGTRTGDVV